MRYNYENEIKVSWCGLTVLKFEMMLSRCEMWRCQSLMTLKERISLRVVILITELEVSK